MQPDRIYIQFAENGHIRKWQRKPFEEGTEYRSSPAREQVTEANASLVSAAEEFCRRVEAGEIRSKRSYAAFKAALSPSPTGGEAGAVAWQHRTRTRDWLNSPWSAWSDWKDGKAPEMVLPSNEGHYDHEERPLYTHPAPLMGEVEAVLKPFARIAPHVEYTDKRDGNVVHRQRVTVNGEYAGYLELTKDDFRAARALLTKLQEGGR